MKSLFSIGVILIVLGAAALIYGGVTYYTKKDVVDFGGSKFRPNRKTDPPVAGFWGVAVLAGVVLVVAGRRGSSRGGTN